MTRGVPPSSVRTSPQGRGLQLSSCPRESSGRSGGRLPGRCDHRWGGREALGAPCHDHDARPSETAFGSVAPLLRRSLDEVGQKKMCRWHSEGVMLMEAGLRLGVAHGTVVRAVAELTAWHIHDEHWTPPGGGRGASPACRARWAGEHGLRAVSRARCAANRSRPSPT